MSKFRFLSYYCSQSLRFSQQLSIILVTLYSSLYPMNKDLCLVKCIIMGLIRYFYFACVIKVTWYFAIIISFEAVCKKSGSSLVCSDNSCIALFWFSEVYKTFSIYNFVTTNLFSRKKCMILFLDKTWQPWKLLKFLVFYRLIILTLLS